MSAIDYDDAMHIQTQDAADAWLEKAVCFYCSLPAGTVRFSNGEPVSLPDRVVEPNPKETITEIKRGLGYYAGYFSDETRERVERLFQCAHPYFGKIAEHGRPKDPLKLGMEIAQRLLEGTTPIREKEEDV